MASFENIIAYFSSNLSTFFHTLTSILIHDNILELYLNPLYLFPIIGILFTGLVVHIFGFTSTSKHPPTVYLFANGKDKRSQLAKKKKKKESKIVKNQSNGSIFNLDLSKSLKSNKVNSGNEISKKFNSSKSALNKSTSNKNVEDKPIKDNSKKKSSENQEKVKTENDGNGGEWIEAVSRKRRSKLKDQINKESEKKLDETKVNKTFLDSVLTLKSEQIKKEKSNGEVNVNNEKLNSKLEKTDLEENLNKAKQAAKSNVSDLISENPDEYAFAAKKNNTSKRVKSMNQKNRKNLESSKSETVFTQNESSKPQTPDKITAAIIASYENDENNVDAKKKPNKKKSSSSKIGEEKNVNKNEKMSKTGQLNVHLLKFQPSVKPTQPVSNQDETKAQTNELEIKVKEAKNDQFKTNGNNVSNSVTNTAVTFTKKSKPRRE